MSGSRKEIEVKLAFDSPTEARQRIERLGARLLHPREIEDNLLFDREVDPLTPSGRMLRLRRTGATSLLTLKAPGEDEGGRYKVRDELETRIDDPVVLAAILRRLGFCPSYRYQKYRTVFEVGLLTICLDETPLGCYVELEGPAAEIDRVAIRLGFTPSSYVTESYRDLHQRAIRDGGRPPGDLLLDPESGTSG